MATFGRLTKDTKVTKKTRHPLRRTTLSAPPRFARCRS